MATSPAAANALELNVGFGTPFQAQIDFLKQKIRLPSERWGDIERGAHDRAFMVSGAAQADLLRDLHEAMVKAAEEGKGPRAFTKTLKSVAAKNGWTGWTGEGTPEGEAWRARVIYQTNMSTSYWAGRRRQMTDPDYLRLRPYWRYLHSDSVMHPRPLHQAWHGITLPHDHPFWTTHFTPNGIGCQCRVESVGMAEGKRSAAAGLGEPPDGWDKINPKTGAPIGIDKGFDYAPGANLDTPLRQFVQDKLITYPPAITRALTLDVNRYVNATQSPAAFVKEVLADSARKDPLWLGFLDTSSAVASALKSDVQGYMLLLPADAPRHIQDHHEWDGGNQRPPTPDDYRNLSAVVNSPDAVHEGTPSGEHQRVVIIKAIGAETFRAIFEVRSGKKNRALTLVTLAIKTAK